MSQAHRLQFGAPRRVSAAKPVSAVLLVALLALFLGAVAALGNLLMAGFILATVGALLALGFPRTMFWISTVGSLAVVGLLELYLPGLQVLRWAFAGMAGLFLLSVLLRQFGARQGEVQPQPALTWTMLAFVLVCLSSMTLNWHSGVIAVAGAKNYFQAWGLFFGLVLMSRWDTLQFQLPKALLAIGLLQLPFALHQFLVLAPVRSSYGGLTSVDVVAGTFGASLVGGGNNAALAMFVIIVSAVVLSLWRRGALRAGWLLVIPPLLVPIFLNESKISVVYLALAIALVFRSEITRRPLRFAAMALATLVIGFGLILSYAALHEASRATTPAELVEEIIRQNTQEGERYGHLMLNRTTSIVHWYEERKHYPLAHALLGHGLSESKISSGVLDTSDNLAGRRYPGMGIGVTSISALLWDVGVIGLASVLMVFWTAFRLAGRLARENKGAPYRVGLFEGLQAGVAIVALSLIHKPFFTFQLGYQVFVLVLLGFLVHAARHAPQDVVQRTRPHPTGRVRGW